jgi:hypothetical protein
MATGLRGDIRGQPQTAHCITDIEWIGIRSAPRTRDGRLTLESKVVGEFWYEPTFTRADVLAKFPVSTEQVPLPGHVDPRHGDRADPLPDVRS